MIPGEGKNFSHLPNGYHPLDQDHEDSLPISKQAQIQQSVAELCPGDPPTEWHGLEKRLDPKK